MIGSVQKLRKRPSWRIILLMFRSIIIKFALPLLCAMTLNVAQSQSPVSSSSAMSVDRIVVQANEGGASPLLPDSILTQARIWDANGEIFVYEAPKFRPRKIAQGIDPVLSPDGGVIAYCGFQPGQLKSQIMMMKSDGSGQRFLTNMDGSPCSPAWSPDEKKLAFTVESERGQVVMVMDFLSKTINPVVLGTLPRWSPDGKNLLFLRKPETHRATASIWVADADGKHAKPVIDTFALMPSADWVSDGRSIVYTNDDHQRSKIFRVNLDGTNPEQIAGDRNLEMYYPTISPDGKKLAVVIAEGKKLVLMEIDIETKKSRWLADGTRGDVRWVKGH